MIFKPEERLVGRIGRAALALGLLMAPLLTVRAGPENTSSEAPTQMNLLDQERSLQVGHRLSYTVLEDRERPIIILVNPRGEVDIPLLGRVEAEGKTCRQLAYEIKSLIEVDFYYQATVLINFPQIADNLGEVILLGEVQRLGPLPIPADDILTVSAAILRAGGFTRGADAEKVTLIRGNPDSEAGEEKYEINVGEMFSTGRFDKDMVVRANDYILVPPLATVGGKFYIWGEVLKPGNYNIPNEKNFTVSKAIFLAGGFGPYANRKKVELIRADRELSASERTIVVNVQEIMEEGVRSHDPIVKADDIIRVKERRFMIQ